MSRQFQVGDKALLVFSCHPAGVRYIGDVVTILSPLRDVKGGPGHEIDLDVPGYDKVYAPLNFLLPLYDDYDPVSWSELADIWTPRETTQ